MTGRLAGKKALITGASSGIGRATALLFAEEGAEVALVARRAEALAEVADDCKRLGGAALALAADVGDEAQVAGMAQRALAAFGAIDVLFNNAGYGRYGPFLSTSVEDWDRMWRVNVRGTVLVTRAIVPAMIAAGGGHIVNMSSIHGVDTSANAAAYCASKFAVTGLSQALSKELWQDGIKVSAICPGGVLTPFLDVPPEDKNPDFLEPDEVARVVLDMVTAPGKALVQQAVVVPARRPYTVPVVG